MIIADAPVLAEDGDGMCELADGPALAPETARRLACDASLVQMIRDSSGQLTQVGDKAPAIPAATRRAIRRRDGGCRFPGCAARAFTNIHHLQHREHGGGNEHGNLLELCWFHHRLVHEGGWNIRVDDRGAVLAIRPNGNVLRAPPAISASQPVSIESTNTDNGVTVEPTTCIPRWLGERLDLDHIITGLLCIDRPELILGDTHAVRES